MYFRCASLSFLNLKKSQEMENIHDSAAASYNKVAKAHAGKDEANVSRETPFRNFNNFVKKNLIQSAMDHLRKSQEVQSAEPSRGVAVLDLASGRGGDLFKWMWAQSPALGVKNGTNPLAVTHYEGYDISSESIAEAKSRFVTAGASANSKVTCLFEARNCFHESFWSEMRDQNPRFGHFDIVSVQFAFHYACGSAESMQQLFSSIFSALRPGGVFIATIVDCEELSKRLLTGEKLRNTLFNIELDSQQAPWEWEVAESHKILPVGVRYSFSLDTLVASPECSVPYHTLLKLSQNCGFVEVPQHSGSFSQFVNVHAMHPKTQRDLKGQKLSLEEMDLVSLYRTVFLCKAHSA